MRFETWIITGFFLFFSGFSQANTLQNKSHCISYQKNLHDHVTFLSSKALEGRLTGTPGETLATEYVANVFYCLGLEPAGDEGTFFQKFVFNAGSSLGKGNSFFITSQQGTTKSLILNQEWRPLSFSDTISFASDKLVFAGYGITAPALGKLPAYDSYKGLNVKGKWVVVFRYTPEKISKEQSQHLSQYASPRYKVFTAKEHGAKGIIFVSGPNAQVKDELIPFSFDGSLAGSGLVALSVKDQILDDLLKNNHLSLKKLQDKLDMGHQLDSSPLLTPIKLTGHISIQQNKKSGRNVLAKLRVRENANQMLVVSAHVDHLGRGELTGSRATAHEKKFIHYGADDNASGVASVLDAALKLGALKAQGQLHGDKDILFAIWSGEELGLLGSAHFIKEFKKKSKNQASLPNLNANINLDMVGRLRKNLILQGVASSTAWAKLIQQVNNQHAIPLVTQADPYLPTDSTSFYLHGIPTLNFFTGAHDEYHTFRDQPQTLNYAGMKNITLFLVDLILGLEKMPAAMDYRQVAKTERLPRERFKIYLGTIPDYASPDVRGVKLAGVTKDSPAEQAGLKANDIILKLAGKKIDNIYDYTFVLGALRVGEEVALVVQRDNKKVAMTIVARARE